MDIMKLAIVCDDLIQHGGAEKVLEVISDIFPQAPIYTSVCSKEWMRNFSGKGRVVKTSFLQKFPFSCSLNRYYSTLLLHVLAFDSFDFSEYDVVLSCSSRYAHFVITKPSTKHICYLHSPGRMFWEPLDYFERENYGILRPLKSLFKSFLNFSLSYLRVADLYASKRVDKFIANSKYCQKKIKRYYNRDSDLLYPPVDSSLFSEGLGEKLEVTGGYYLVITRLVSWKRVDIAIEACMNLNEKLKIIGLGPDMKRLKSISNSSIEFLGYIDDEEKFKLIRNCKAIIFTQKEDFGIVPLEAMACGKPVIAYGEGGAVETVIPGETGEFFDEQTSESVTKVLKSFDSEKYSPDKCLKRAEEFDTKVFNEKLRSFINKFVNNV